MYVHVLSELSGSVLHVIRYHNKAPFAKANKSSVIQRHFMVSEERPTPHQSIAISLLSQ